MPTFLTPPKWYVPNNSTPLGVWEQMGPTGSFLTPGSNGDVTWQLLGPITVVSQTVELYNGNTKLGSGSLGLVVPVERSSQTVIGTPSSLIAALHSLYSLFSGGGYYPATGYVAPDEGASTNQDEWFAFLGVYLPASPSQNLAAMVLKHEYTMQGGSSYEIIGFNPLQILYLNSPPSTGIHLRLGTTQSGDVVI